MVQAPLSFGINDVCGHLYFLLNCDGTVNTDEDPMLFCGISSSTLRKTVDEGEEQEAPNPSSTTGKNCLRRPAIPTPSDKFLDETTCGLFSPKWMSWAGLEAPLIDADGEFCGWEDIVAEESNCQSCGKEQGGCRHSLAKVQIMNAWCGEERHPKFGYVFAIFPSLETQLVENEIEFGAGFTSFLETSFRLKSNPNFTDPWGILADADGNPQGMPGCYRFKALECPPGSPLEEIIGVSCSCIHCGDSETLLAG
jgi:hypothetical protein